MRAGFRGLRDSQTLLSGIAHRLPEGPRRAYGRALARVGSTAARGSRTGPRAATWQVVGLDAAGQRDRARGLARSTAASAPGSGGATRLAMARYLDRIGDAEGVWGAVGGIEPAKGTDALEWRRLQASSAEDLGRYSDARSSLDAGLRVAPEDRRLRRQLKHLDRTVGRYEAAPAVGRGTPPAGWAPVPGRVLHIAPRAIPEFEGGSTVRIHQDALAQRDAGMDPTVLSLYRTAMGGGGRAHTSPLGVVDGVRYMGLEAIPESGDAKTGHPSAPDGARAAIEELRPAALQASTPFDNAHIAFTLRARYGIPVVYEVRGFREEGWLARGGSPDADRYALERDADTRHMLAADAVVTLGEAMKAEIVGRGVPAEHITVVPNSVDVDRFVPGVRPADLAAALGIAPDDVVVGSISTFQRHEDFDSFVKAVGLLHQRGLPARGLLVGAGPQLAAIRKQVAGAGLEAVIVLPGRVPRADVARYHQLMDVFVLARKPSRMTDMVTPLKPFEAMATGRPVVTSRTPALLEVVDEGRTGLGFDPEDAEGLADVLGRLVADPAERRRIGETARSWVVAERSLQRTGARYRQLYERLGAC